MASLIDSGPLLGSMLRQALGDRAGRVAAALPALVAIAELALIWWLAVEVAGARASAGAVLVAATAIAHYQQAYGVRENAVAAGPGSFVIGTDLRLMALALIVVVPASVLTGTDAEGWATSSVWALALLVAVSSTARSLQAWITPNGPGGAASHGASADSNGHNEATTDRMKSVNAGTGTTVPRQAIGGVR
jgi:hypothetical protein